MISQTQSINQPVPQSHSEPQPHPLSLSQPLPLALSQLQPLSLSQPLLSPQPLSGTPAVRLRLVETATDKPLLYGVHPGSKDKAAAALALHGLYREMLSKESGTTDTLFQLVAHHLKSIVRSDRYRGQWWELGTGGTWCVVSEGVVATYVATITKFYLDNVGIKSKASASEAAWACRDSSFQKKKYMPILFDHPDIAVDSVPASLGGMR